jgi:hypothetical protein
MRDWEQIVKLEYDIRFENGFTCSSKLFMNQEFIVQLQITKIFKTDLYWRYNINRYSF